MAGKRQSQVMDARSTKGFTSGGESNEILRIASKGAYLAKMSNAFDPTREHLDFEVKGSKVVPIDKTKSIGKRMRENISDRGVKDPNEGSDQPRYRTVVDFIFGGSQEQMRKLAFGDQNVNYDKGADNSDIVRKKDIENWAIDLYNFIAKKYGEQNIAAFVVHLDETNPHVHCKLLPITSRNKFSYRKVMIGESNTKDAYRKSMLNLHNEIYEQVNKKYGLERGEHVSETKAQHRTTEQYHEEHRLQLERENIILEADNAKLSEDNTRLAEDNKNLSEENENLNKEIKHALIRVNSLNTMITNLTSQIEDLNKQVDELNQKKDAGLISQQGYNIRIEQLQKDINYLAEKKLDKEKKYRNAQIHLDELQKETEEARKENTSVQERLADMQKQLKTDLPIVQQEVMNKMQKIGYSAIIRGTIDFWDSFKNVMHESTPEEESFLVNKIMPLYDENLKDFADNAGNIAQIATNLFLGFVDQETTISASCGGDGGPESEWGRKKDEDDWHFMQRCYLMGMKMAHHKKKIKENINNGLRR